MFLQNGKPRRKPLVYGKVKRSNPAYDVFNIDDPLGGGPQSRSSSKQDEPQLGQQHIHGQVVKSVETTPEAKLSNFRQRLVSDEKPVSTKSSTQKDSATQLARHQRNAAFDFPLSDEEDGATIFEKPMQKRRRLTPVRNSVGNVKSHQREPSGSNTTQHSREKFPNNRAATSSQAQTNRQSGSRVAQQSPQRTRTPVPEGDGFSSQASPYSTPKQTRLLSNLLNTTHPADSPSKLPLTSLSLTNGEGSAFESITSSSELLVQTKRVQKRLLKPKKRLIDAMVSPRKRLSVSASSESTSQGSALNTAESLCETDDMRNKTQPVGATGAYEMNEKRKTGDLGANNSATSPSMCSKPRLTYSRERSHLADVLIDDLLDPVSQSASQEDSLLVSQNGAIFSSFESVISHEGSDEDLEQEIAGIRSIHELRHSGGNARSRVDLESTLEDIEAKGPLARARRLRGLTQLTEKLGDPEVGRHISDHSLEKRLSGCPQLEEDVVGQVLLTMILSRLMSNVKLPITSLKGVSETLVRSGTNLLQESRDLASVVRDRKQNLSKTICREIIALVEPFCSSLVWPDERPKSLSPRLASIRSIDIVLRQVRQLDDFDMVLPASIFSQLIQILLRISPIQLVEDEGSVLVMESTISIMESLTLSKNWAQDGGLEIAKKLSGLGPLLGQLTLSPAGSSIRSRHLILRLILNITNKDSDLCDAFSEPALVLAIFGIVKRDFLQTPMLINTVLKESKLEGVILALGALSNLAEHSKLFRQGMLECSLDGRSVVDWIAFAFRDQVEAASEVRSLPSTD